MRYRFALLSCWLAAALTTACDAPPAGRAAAASASATVTHPRKDGLIPGTPAGDLGDWVREIRSGIQAIPPQVATDAPAAQRAALDLYVTRQEYAEMYYGGDGRIPAGAALAGAIDTAEVRFHELLRLLGTPSPSIDGVRAAVAALDEQQALVGRLWQQSGVHLQRQAVE